MLDGNAQPRDVSLKLAILSAWNDATPKPPVLDALADTVSVPLGTMQPIRPTSAVMSRIMPAVGQEKSGRLTHCCAAGTCLHELDAGHDDHERMVPLWRLPMAKLAVEVVVVERTINTTITLRTSPLDSD